MADYKPLWRVMDRAYTESFEKITGPDDLDEIAPSVGYAAEIRAIADEVERRGDAGLDLDPGETADWLRAEADRAETGE